MYSLFCLSTLPARSVAAPRSSSLLAQAIGEDAYWLSCSKASPKLKLKNATVRLEIHKLFYFGMPVLQKDSLRCLFAFCINS